MSECLSDGADGVLSIEYDASVRCEECGRPYWREVDICANFDKAEVSVIDIFMPSSVSGRAAGTTNGLINGKETYRRILIRRKNSEASYGIIQIYEL